jgi:hypothetical protein
MDDQVKVNSYQVAGPFYTPSLIAIKGVAALIS